MRGTICARGNMLSIRYVSDQSHVVQRRLEVVDNLDYVVGLSQEPSQRTQLI